MTNTRAPLGLYIHIPFCSFQCHYCDFAKTANWDRTLIRNYMQVLSQHLDIWLREFVCIQGYSIDTLFLGGGTPGLLGDELEPLFQTLERFGIRCEEATIECNPENISIDKVKIWKDFGINRLSMGIQSFQAHGLQALTRQHSPEQLHRSIELACDTFSNVSCDLIYAWPGQKHADWEHDLHQLQRYPLSHASLYCLTYEDRTPMGRAHYRGRLGRDADDFQEECYQMARQFLSEQGWTHYECSNWTRNSHISRHNAKYWQDAYFIGVGVGACGYVPVGDIGLRYGYQRKERPFTKNPPSECASFRELPFCDFETRTKDDWLIEYVGCGLRYSAGIDLNLIQQKTTQTLQPQGLVAEALGDGRLHIKDGRLHLSSAEWFRETRWCLEVLKSFVS